MQLIAALRRVHTCKLDFQAAIRTVLFFALAVIGAHVLHLVLSLSLTSARAKPWTRLTGTACRQTPTDRYPPCAPRVVQMLRSQWQVEMCSAK